MIVFLVFAAMMALSAAWLLIMPSLASGMSRIEKRKAAFYVAFATFIFPFTLYYLVTF